MAAVQLTGIGGKQVSVETGLFINNEFVPSVTGSTLDIENPTTGEKLVTVAAAQKEDVDIAVKAAQAAFTNGWKDVLPSKRGELLRNLATLIERDADEMASLEALDVGIPFGDSKNMHIPQAGETLRYFAGWSDKITGQLLQIPQGYAYTRREPIGVCATIVPWNAPLMITIWKVAPAIAAGNVLIIKSPEIAPLYAQKLAALVKEAGFPPGVIQVLCGEGHTAGQALSEHMSVKKLAFTGSSFAGRKVLKAAADSNFKKVTLELGGKGPSIVFPDADVENALFWTTIGITVNNGQVCAAGSRIYVHSSIYDSFLVAFGERIAKTAALDPLAEGCMKGPIVSKKQKDRIQEYVKFAKETGLKLVGEGPTTHPTENGHFVPNVAFGDVPNDNRLMQEEIFGPVASIGKFDTEAEVIAKANDTDYGLAAAIFTENIHRADRVSAAIESGMVTVNSWATLNANTPFGGVKQSGFGRDMGEEALDGWLVTKVVKHNVLPSKENL